MLPETDKLIYNWNSHPIDYPYGGHPENVKIHDESHRDGLQCHKVREPSLDETLQQIRLMDQAGIDCVNVGFPVSSNLRYEMIRKIAKAKVSEGWNIDLMCGARLKVPEIEQITSIANEAGVEIWVGTFIASSKLRMEVMGWEIKDLVDQIPSVIKSARNYQLPIMFVTEDSTRSFPEVIKIFNTAAIDAGANRICITDTVGHIREPGVRKLVGYVKYEIIKDLTVDGRGIELEWHGHNHRGLALSNTLAAIEAGVDRVEGTFLGRGEMMGNCATELIALNMVLEGWATYDLTLLGRIAKLYAKSTGVQIPNNWPIVGADAYQFGSGVHADAYLKGLSGNKEELAEMVYSAYPPSLVGRISDSDVNPMSGKSSVQVFLLRRGIANVSDDQIDRILKAVKESQYSLTDEEIIRLLNQDN